MAKMFNEKIKHQVFIKAEPEKVYDTVTSAEGWDAFFTHGMELEPKAGGKIIWRWKDYGPNFYNVEAHGKVLKADRPRLFVFKWFPVGKEEEGTQITFDIQGQYGGTVIRLTEEGYPDTPEGRAMILECASGWGEALALLKFYLERGVVYIQPEK